MDITKKVATRSSCIRRGVGALLVRDKRILTTGYNGVPSGISHCTKETCLRIKGDIPSGTRHELCRGLHAEQNAIIQAALHGISTKDSTLYVTCSPCLICVKMLINSGIKEIIYDGNYPDSMALDMLKEANIICRGVSCE